MDKSEQLLTLDELRQQAQNAPYNQQISVATVDQIMRLTVATISFPVAFLGLVLFILFGPEKMPPYKENLLALVEGLFAACVYFWFGGQLVGKIDGLNQGWKLAVKFGGAIGAFFVIWLMASPYCPFPRPNLVTPPAEHQASDS